MRRAGASPVGMSTEEAEARLRATLERVAVWPVADDWRAAIDAELSGADRAGSDPDAWRAAAAAAARGRLPVRLHVHTLRRLAEELLLAGQRGEAETALRDALAIAERAGFAHATRLLEALAQRSRLVLPSGRARGTHPPLLTARERRSSCADGPLRPVAAHRRRGGCARRAALTRAGRWAGCARPRGRDARALGR